MYQVDAFASSLFSGNPAAVVPLPSWLPETLLQDIAAENNLSETVFFVAEAGHYHIRWFTPSREVELCGHGTLAAAHVIFHYLDRDAGELQFHSRSGVLAVRRHAERLELDFPLQMPVPGELDDAVIEALGARPREVWDARYRLLVFDEEGDVRRMAPDFPALGRACETPVIVTAPGQQEDFVCRFFAPRFGIDEDPVTGSAYTILAPYWSDRLGRDKLEARQVSPRGGAVGCRVAGDRVHLAGQTVLYLKGTVFL